VYNPLDQLDLLVVLRILEVGGLLGSLSFSSGVTYGNCELTL
jgi:hypothetical protein